MADDSPPPGNPAGIPKGEKGTYILQFGPPGVYDDHIKWETINDLVTIQGEGKGPIVTVQAGSMEGFSGLTAKVMNWQYPTLFHIKVIPLEDVLVSVFIVKSNDVQAITENGVYEKFEEANWCLRQAGVRLVVHNIQYTNNPAWYNLVYGSGNMQALNSMRSVNNPSNGLKLFFVNTINNPEGSALGINDDWCMAIAKNANNATLAHEVGHACDWRDIYISRGGLNIHNAGFVKENYMTPKDWGAGLYSKSLLHSDLVKRLLMYGVSDAMKGYIPHGSIYGVYRPTRRAPLTIGMSPIGLDTPTFTRQPKHVPYQP